jgi:two-component system, NarL family, nitrate/nitrite response regulator NarL
MGDVTGNARREAGMAERPLFGDALVISEVRFLRDTLVDILQRRTGLGVCSPAATLSQALHHAAAVHPGMVLLDVAFPGGRNNVAQLRHALPHGHIIAFGIRETEENILTWAEAGIAGYVPNTASIEELIALVEQIRCGEQCCSSRISGSLLRRIASAGRRASSPQTKSLSTLTPRESEIMGLVVAGHSNKDISRLLRISVGTTKSHVHNLLAKLSLRRRSDVMVRMHGIQHRHIDPAGR